MDIVTSLILGTLQGATEFLPISSSGHLVIAEKILGNRASTGLIFEVFVHFGTMASVLIYFRKKIWQMIKFLIPPYTTDKMPMLKLVGIIIVSTIPIAVTGLTCEAYINQAFGSPKVTSLMLLITASVLLATSLVEAGKLEIGLVKGFFIGIAQAVALLPGISRSGMTISAGLFLKVSPAQAVEFSFLLSLPAVFGAAFLKAISLASEPIPVSIFGVYLAGAICAFIIGYLAIAWLMQIVRKGRFFYFGIYCLVIGITGLLFL